VPGLAIAEASPLEFEAVRRRFSERDPQRLLLYGRRKFVFRQRSNCSRRQPLFGHLAEVAVSTSGALRTPHILCCREDAGQIFTDLRSTLQRFLAYYGSGASPSFPVCATCQNCGAIGGPSIHALFRR